MSKMTETVASKKTVASSNFSDWKKRYVLFFYFNAPGGITSFRSVTIQQNIKGLDVFPNFFGDFYGFRQKKVKKI